ncbi:MAG: multidrug effflux MFS transporter [Sphingomonadales bacterium]
MMPIGSIVAIAVLIAALPRITASIYTPSMPSMVDHFNTTHGMVEFTFTAYIVGLAAGQLVYGPLSDLWGRRPVLLAGLAIFAACSLLAAFVPTIEYMAVGRFVQAFSAAAGGVLARAMIRDLMGPERTVRAIAYVTMATTLSPAVGPLVGGQFEYYFGWQSIFLALSAAGAILIAVCWFLLPETRPPSGASSPVGLRALGYGFFRLARSRPFLAYSFAGGMLLASQLVFFARTPFLFIETLGITPRDFGLYSIAGVIGFMAGNFIVTRRRGVGDTARMVLTGSVIACAGTTIMLIMAAAIDLTVWSMILPFVIVTLGGGIAMPNAFAGCLNRHPEIAGTSSSLSGFINMTVSAAATAALGLVPGSPAVSLAVMMLGLTIGSVLVAWSNPERHAVDPP